VHIRFTNLDKVLFPRTGFTKGDLIEYYLRVAPVLLPHLEGRPITIRRFPDGVDGPSFFEKHPSQGTPSWVRRVTLSSGTYVLVEDVETLALLANLAAIELHVPQWRVDDSGVPKPPDLLVFDLDPGAPAGITECAKVATLVAATLRSAYELDALPKTSGSKGLQLYARWNGPGDTRAVARAVAEHLAQRRPQLVVANMTKSLRRGRVLIDWSQNHVAKTTVAPYSLRANPEPTVSTPLQWTEVERAASGEGSGLTFLADQVLDRIDELGDLFAPLLASDTVRRRRRRSR